MGINTPSKAIKNISKSFTEKLTIKKNSITIKHKKYSFKYKFTFQLINKQTIIIKVVNSIKNIDNPSNIKLGVGFIIYGTSNQYK
jgi:hypothetical protein